MLYNVKDILDLGEKGGFAIPAFNVYNLEEVIGVMKAAEETGAPVIFQLFNRLAETSSIGRFLAPSILEAIKSLKTPAAFHLDHGTGEPNVLRAIRYGTTGVMIDASTYDYAENVKRTKRIVDIAKEVGVAVEGELGHVGSTKDEKIGEYTETDEAVRFVNETGVDALAIMVGTAHGHYKKAPVLAIDRIKEIHAKTKAHLVLHGGSGVPDDQIKMAIDAGIRKINFATDVNCTYLAGFRRIDCDTMPLDVMLSHPTNDVKNFAIEKIKLLGADKYQG